MLMASSVMITPASNDLITVVIVDCTAREPMSASSISLRVKMQYAVAMVALPDSADCMLHGTRAEIERACIG